MFSSIKRKLTNWLNPHAPENGRPKTMEGPVFKQIETVDGMLAASRGKKILLLKHSSTCPISSRAKYAVEELMAENPVAEVYLVVVQERRDISNEIEEKLGVRHQTPQLLLIEDGNVSEHWSHHYITSETAGAALGLS